MPKGIKAAKPTSIANYEHLKSVLRGLAKNGEGLFFMTIRRRVPPGGQTGWYKKNIPLEHIVDLEALCRQGGEEWEYFCRVHDANGQNVIDAEGHPIGEYVIPPTKTTEAAGTSSVDPDLVDWKKDLRRRREELDLQKEQRRIDREQARLEKNGGAVDGEDEYVEIPHLGAWVKKGSMLHTMAMQGGMGGAMFPWMQPPKQDSPLKDLVPVLIAWISRPQQTNPLADPVFLKLLMGEKMSPKDLIGMFAPMVAEMGKASSEANRTAMASMAEMDKEIKLRMLDAIMTDPTKDAQEVNKWRQWLGLGKEVLKDAVGVVKSAVGGDGTKKDPAKIGKRDVPGLPAPKGKEGEKSAEPGGEEKTGGTEGGGEASGTEAPPAQDPKAKSEALKKARVEAFLLACEEEALAESHPVAVADKLGELYDFLPKSIRDKIEAAMYGEAEPSPAEVALVLGEFKSYCPEIVDRISAAALADQSKALITFYGELLDTLANPEEDEEEPPTETEKENA